MRINIQVPRPNGGGGDEYAAADGSALASSSRLDLSKIPLPLVELAKSSSIGGGGDSCNPANGADSEMGELVLIELQGTLEIDDADPEGGQVLAKLEFHKGREDKPTLLVSHHRLEGKIVSLPKPFVVLERKQRVASDEERQALGMVDTNGQQELESKKAGRMHRDLPSSPMPFYNERRLATPPATEDAGAGLDSPTMSRKRAHATNSTDDKQELLQPASPHAASMKTRADNALSSSPMPPPRAMRGSEVDYSSPVSAWKRQRIAEDETSIEEHSDAQRGASRVEAADDEEWLYKTQTATYFDVVCIIRKKILFSKRPEPVVRLDGEGADEARAAIGRSLAV